MTQILETRDLAIGYRRRRKSDVTLARGLKLALGRGELVGLLGPNGIGKSTLLRTLAGMQAPLAGQVLLCGRNVAGMSPAEMARRLSLVLTRTPPANLMNGYALVALGRHPHTDWLGRLSENDRARVDWALDAVNARALADQRVAELSDGQRQKLMIARALAQDSQLMLLDEPTAYLDLPRRVETMHLLQSLAHATERAILVSTHDLDLALRHCDRLWLMSEAGIAEGMPEDLALDGSLGEAFQADGITFDRGSAAFVLDRPRGRPVQVRADGIAASWLWRALERRGFSPVRTPQAIAIEQGSIMAQARLGGSQLNGSSSSHSSIQALLAALEEHSV